jgi:glycosyltransferase involved in cell wall biosynthesis
MTHIGFIIEQALGHITHTKNLQANVPKDSTVDAHWGLIPYEVSGFAAKVPVYKSNWTVRAGLRARRVVGQLAKETPLDALFFHTQVPAVLATNWIKKIPSVVSLDATPKQYDSLGEFYAHQPGPAWLENLKWRRNRDCFREAKQLVTWSTWAKQGLIDEYEVPPDKITVIPPGVNSADWRCPTPRDRHTGPIKILFVGGHLERKGGLVLLEAWRLITRHSSLIIELHLVTKELVAPEPNLFVYHNLQPNSGPLKQLYFDSDIFCLPTYGDCLPMVLSEAGAAGLPSVSTSVAAIPEITHEGETGFIVPPGDASALAAALGHLIEDADLRLKLGARAVEVVTRNFDAERNALKLLDVLKQVAKPAQ